MFVCLFVCLLACLFVCLFVYLFDCCSEGVASRGKLLWRPWPRKLSGFTRVIRDGMWNLGWLEEHAPWTWYHEGLPSTVALKVSPRVWNEDGRDFNTS